ncbi:hypothetical protein OXB14_006385 [Bacteroides hominis]|uniref:Uncharacterized protein n=2 Tax=Bacteroides TaxID=816 RepID=A0AAP9SX19_BACFG|nr:MULTISPECIES: hypothetical protein [Bacteroides]MBM6509761.1 hypothetical protein [Bacteroides fragilis]MCE8611722.1 hypothetical protein [Bacteroides fragilis]MCE9327955.1 hypothetical protein [Bacteroides fragilis]MCE9449707.1 hypothetical protein [Bacteroides fragilis]MCY2675104.1 hypothetical protein [Bacteroides fragilis]
MECNRLSGQMQPSVWAEARLFTSQSNGLEGMESRGKSRKAPGSGTPGDKGTKKEEALRASSSTAF